MDEHGTYIGRVIYDSDLADTANKRPLNRVKVLIEGKTDTDSNPISYKHPRGNKISINDSNYPDDIDSHPPAANYSIYGGYDGFTQTNIGTAGINTTSNAYTPDNRSNAGKGLYALPGVGSTVLIGFLNSKRGLPIVLGCIPGYDSIDTVHRADAEGVYPNLPLAYSNIKQ